MSQKVGKKCNVFSCDWLLLVGLHNLIYVWKKTLRYYGNVHYYFVLYQVFQL